MEDTFIKYEYEVKVENTLYPIIVCYKGKSQIIEYPILRFDSTEKLTKEECYKLMKSTRGIISITGDFKEEKYYTPEISEFHIGFECEKTKPNLTGYHNEIDLNKPEIWKNYSINEYDFNLEMSWFRVKYLDQKDIESCGFKYISDNYFIFNKKYELFLLSDRIIIKEFLTENNLNLRLDNPRIVAYPLFEGTIKNKSVFKQVLKIVGIM